jgi:hypothetical protein
VNLDVPVTPGRIIERRLEKKPMDRIQSADELHSFARSTSHISKTHSITVSLK